MSERIAHEPGTKPLPGERFTFEEFLETDLDHHFYEWVNGEALEMAPIEDGHARATQYLSVLLGMYVEAKNLGQVLAEPFLLRVAEDLPARAPDIQVILKSGKAAITRLYTKGPADLVIEVASPSTRVIDRSEKFQEYLRGGVPEYWIVDAMRRRAEFFQMDCGIYIPVDLDDAGRYHSRSIPGFWLQPEWIWNEKPKLEVLKLLGIL